MFSNNTWWSLARLNAGYSHKYCSLIYLAPLTNYEQYFSAGIRILFTAEKQTHDVQIGSRSILGLYV